MYPLRPYKSRSLEESADYYSYLRLHMAVTEGDFDEVCHLLSTTPKWTELAMEIASKEGNDSLCGQLLLKFNQSLDLENVIQIAREHSNVPLEKTTLFFKKRNLKKKVLSEEPIVQFIIPLWKPVFTFYPVKRKVPGDSTQIKYNYQARFTKACCKNKTQKAIALFRESEESVDVTEGLSAAALHGNINLVRYLLFCSPREFNAAFLYACREGHLNIAYLLVEYSKDYDIDISLEGGLVEAKKEREEGIAQYLSFLLERKKKYSWKKKNPILSLPL